MILLAMTYLFSQACILNFSTQVNLVLEDAVEYVPSGDGTTTRTDLKSEILLNGNQIAVLVPGGSPPDDSLAAMGK